MAYLLTIFLTLGTFANTFRYEDPEHGFSLQINARKLVYASAKSILQSVIRRCNVHLARALNAELLELIPRTEDSKGRPFSVDGNTYYVFADGGEALKLREIELRMKNYLKEEESACPN